MCGKPPGQNGPSLVLEHTSKQLPQKPIVQQLVQDKRQRHALNMSETE